MGRAVGAHTAPTPLTPCDASGSVSYPLGIVGVMTLLADLAARRDTDLTGLDDAGLAGLGSLIARGRRDLAAFATAVAVEAKRRQVSGSSPCPEDLSDPDGEQSQRSRAKDSARGEIRDDLPESGAGAESGVAKTENADHLAERLGRLSSSEKQRLAGHDRGDREECEAVAPRSVPDVAGEAAGHGRRSAR